MEKLLRLVTLILFGFSITNSCLGQIENKIFFEENKNQFPSTVQYKVDLPGSRLFLEKNKFTYVKYSREDLGKIHDSKHSQVEKNRKAYQTPIDEIIRLHSFQATFINSNPNVKLTAEKKSSFYHNYFIGNDSKKWVSEIYSYEKITYTNLYQNIDLVAYSKDNQFKYDFIIQAGADPNQIQINYDGAEQLQIKSNTLIIKTSIGDIVESIPLAYQIINNKQINISCTYQLSNENKITFQFPNGYNKNYQLIIDPILVAATYSGGAIDTYGHSATYDNSGNIYTGGECFGPGYPASVGAYQTTFSGSTDIAISKLNPNGSNLIWATYLGGSFDEIPNSLFVNNSGEIYVMGATTSSNYPVTAGCFDNLQNGAEDIVVSHLNATGTALIGSTYIGGSGNEGQGGIYWMNGHDGMRGEIIVDQFNNAWVANYTSSANFPTTTGAYDQTYNGGAWDACVFKLSSNMSSLLWSTFLGGGSDDVGYGLRLNSSGEVYVTGLTTDNTFPATPGTYQSVFQGGASDGYVTRFNSTGSALIASTFIGGTGGTSDYDASYFIALDNNDNPYIFGASQGAMPVTAGVYSNAGSGNFISKLNPNLTALIYSTVVGSGTAGFLEPEAFMVDTCENVYIAGFGSTPAYPVTSSALYSTQAAANGGNCYLMTLSKDATSLLYGSFYFGWHVDGGTSRFDPSGTIYLGICMGSPVASTPAWAWDNGAMAPSWDMFVLKMDFQMAGVNATASISPNDTICLGQSVTFTNTSNGVTYEWDFGDGSPISNVVSPTHTYTSVGTYTVLFKAIDLASCNLVDSTFLTITVLPIPIVNLGNDTLICGTINFTLDAGISGTIYNWSTGATTQTINVTASGTYWVSISNGVCTNNDTIIVQAFVISSPLGNDTVLCNGQTIVLNANNTGANYLWSTGATTQTITATADSYWVTITLGACTISDTVIITFVNYPIVNLNDSSLCPGASVVLDAGIGASSYLWSTGSITQSINVNSTGIYFVIASNGSCAVSDTSSIIILTVPDFEKEISLCEVVNTLTLDAGAYTGTYLWSTGANSQSIEITSEGNYWVTINSNGCVFGDTTKVTGDLGGGAIYFPNAFTPNKNGLNDLFTAYGADIVFFHLSIFNRWGELIFETEDITIGWDGKYKGELAKQDVYVWKIQYKTKCKDGLTERIGHVTVVR